jgi:hypothetical protein
MDEYIKREPVPFEYNRQQAVQYAHMWAYKRNPAFFNFEKSGGDCTNFASQVIFAGSGIMNYTPTYGWHYIDINRRTPSWTGVDFLHDFLINNKGIGPYAEETDIGDIMPGDIIQLCFDNGSIFHHSPVVIRAGNSPAVENILVAAHTDDQDYYPLKEYDWIKIRYIHILGVRR